MIELLVAFTCAVVVWAVCAASGLSLPASGALSAVVFFGAITLMDEAE